MFTTDDAIDLLTLAAAYDRRTIGQGDVHAWHDAATRAGWTRDAAFEAVKAHYATSTAWLMPGHVTDRIRADRRQPPPLREVLGALPPSELRALPAGPDALPKWTPPPSKPARRRRFTAEERARAQAELDAVRPTGDEAAS